jgi:hypothetical protein
MKLGTIENIKHLSQVWWYMSAILAPQKAEAGGPKFKASRGKYSSETLSQKQNKNKRAGSHTSSGRVLF